MWTLALLLFRGEGYFGPEIALQLLISNPDARYNLRAENHVVLLIYKLPCIMKTCLRCSGVF